MKIFSAKAKLKDFVSGIMIKGSPGRNVQYSGNTTDNRALKYVRSKPGRTKREINKSTIALGDLHTCHLSVIDGNYCTKVQQRVKDTNNQQDLLKTPSLQLSGGDTSRSPGLEAVGEKDCSPTKLDPSARLKGVSLVAQG